MSVFAGIVSSSGTDVPAQDWTLIGEDHIDAGTSNELAVLGGALSYSSVKFIADIDSSASQTLTIHFPDDPSDAKYYEQTITESGISEVGWVITTVSTPGGGLACNLDSAGRYVIFGEITQSDIPGTYGRVVINLQRTNSASDYQMTTIEGWMMTAGPWSTANFTMSGTTGFKTGSRLSVYSSPASVTG